jgi:hypothetical protein
VKNETTKQPRCPPLASRETIQCQKVNEHDEVS